MKALGLLGGLPLGLFNLAGSVPLLRFGRAAAAPRLLPEPRRYSTGGKHWMGSHAPVCRECAVTLSHGRCVQKMCGALAQKRRLKKR